MDGMNHEHSSAGVLEISGFRISLDMFPRLSTIWSNGGLIVKIYNERGGIHQADPEDTVPSQTALNHDLSKEKCHKSVASSIFKIRTETLFFAPIYANTVSPKEFDGPKGEISW